MERIPAETRVIYDLLRADFDSALARTTTERNEEMVAALNKLDTKLDQLSGRIDDVKLSIGVDLDELRGELGDRTSASKPTSPTEDSGQQSASKQAFGDLRPSTSRHVPPRP